ncbi:sigma-70 family RNA polymerase sigma factor [Dactylosporangium sp. NPDC051541]|uniref:sigma-70 family RNA polymerase sigma factor n=1 Tax=Dactylosporangium sp. NPDC051541 TaxID=3363977 RepID=UPI0037932B95
MDEREWLNGQFEVHRGRLRAVAFRMLGSAAEADDAVQDAWLRVDRAGADGVDNVGAWLTTIVARVCLNQLRSRTQRREDPLDVHVPDPIVSPAAGVDPEHEALLADSVGLALLVVLETLTPAERLAFVLHDMFAVPFEEIAPMLERTPAAARQLASRARRRVQGRPTAPDPDVARQRAVVDAFFAASRGGDFAALVGLLDPDIILRSDGGAARAKFTFTLHGPEQVATQALASSRLSPFVYPALVNGAAGVVVATAPDRPLFVMAFTVTEDRIVAIDVLADPDRLRGLDLAALRAGGTVGE